jgi:hypothetical protein
MSLIKISLVTQKILMRLESPKMEFEMKDLVRNTFFFGLQLEHLQTSILVHQSLMSIKYWRNSLRIKPI